MLICRLRILMAENKIDNITELMKLSGLSRNAIDRLYKEKDIQAAQVETIIKLCDVLGCKMSELLEYVPDDIEKFK